MFLRRYHKRKNGKQHTYWALVESYRTAKGSRQHIVAYLGELKKNQKSGWEQLGRNLDGKAKPQKKLFDPPDYQEPDDEFVHINLKDVRLKRIRDFGDIWLALGLWRLLELDKVLEDKMPWGRQEVPGHTVAAILTIARFCEPASELHIEEKWYPRTALDDLLGVAPEKVHTDRLYEAMDRLLAHKADIEKHLKDRLGDLFDLDFEVMLYDLTSTYFEGQCLNNPMAKRGYSRDHRPDCLQVCIALIVTPEGIPVGHEVFDGNTHDSKTVQQIMDELEKRYGQINRVWVMDRGMVSEENLRYLRQHQGRYIIGTPKRMLRKFEHHLLGKDWHEVQAGVQVKLIRSETDPQEVFVLARSDDRQKKEQAMHQRFIDRMEEALKKLQYNIETGHLKDINLAHQRLGRIRQRYWRGANAFAIKIEKKLCSEGKPRLKMSWSCNRQWHDWACLSEGCYLLRTNMTDVDPQTLWKQYIQLTDVEWAFRITKDELVIRPIWHQKADRVRGHILICFLAYALWKTLSQWMKLSGLGEAPRTLLEEMFKIKSGDVCLKAYDQHSQVYKEIMLRCVTTADEAQQILLHRLGLTLPKRLARIDKITQM
jgi:transposase